MIRFDEIRPGSTKWKLKRDFVFRGLEAQLALEHGRVDVLARHSMNGMFAGIRDILANRISNAEAMRYGLKATTFPWLKFISPEEQREEQVQQQVQRVEAFNKALKLDPSITAAIESSSGGMLERHRKYIEEQRDQVRAEGAAEEALKRVRKVIDAREQEAQERKRRMARQS